MSHRNVIFDAANGELRNDVTFFEQFDSQPFDIMWRDDLIGLEVEPGDELGRLVWPGQPEQDRVILVPAGCRGIVTWAPDMVEYNRLDQEPSQVLVQLDVADSTMDRTG